MTKIKKEHECSGVCSTCGKCTVDFSSDVISEDMDMINIEVFGSGVFGAQLFENVKEAESSMGPTVSAEYVSDIGKISDIGFIKLPALLINGNLISQGKVLLPKEISSFIVKFI